MEPMFGHYVIKKENFERWLNETSLLKGAGEAGYAAIDSRKLLLNTFRQEGRYTFHINPPPEGRPTSSKLVLEFTWSDDDHFDQPSIKMLIEELRVEHPAPAAKRKLGPIPAPPNWDVLDRAIETGQVAAEADRKLLCFAARELLAAIQQLQEHRLP